MTIKELRALTGMSQGKFAKHLGIPINTLHHWEQGLRQPPAYIPVFIEKVLKYDGIIEDKDYVKS